MINLLVPPWHKLETLKILSTHSFSKLKPSAPPPPPHPPLPLPSLTQSVIKPTNLCMKDAVYATVVTSIFNLFILIKNPFPYSQQAFKLVNDAWAVLSNPMRKSIYDSELNHYMPHQHQLHHQFNSLGFDIEQQQHNFFTVANIGSNRVETTQPQQQQQHKSLERNNGVNGNSGVRRDGGDVEVENEGVDGDEDDDVDDGSPTASQAIRVKSPPAIVEGQEAYFYCWGVKENLKEKAVPKKNVRNSGPRVYIDDETDDIFTGVSEPSDDSDHEWNNTKKKKAK
ncbi:mediator of RNA polymerase II transcription subunit 15-like protein [Tanacetum coccineum]